MSSRRECHRTASTPSAVGRLVAPEHFRAAAQATHGSRHGLGVLLGDEELLVRFDDLPSFRHVTIAQIGAVEWSTPDHLYWAGRDVDLSVNSIRDPRAFPLISKADR